jgi:hypothetical protein
MSFLQKFEPLHLLTQWRHMEPERVHASLQAAELCLTEGLWDSAMSRAYYALFQAAICALESRGLRRREWTHKGVHSDFVQHFVRRRKLVPASFAGPCPVSCNCDTSLTTNNLASASGKPNERCDEPVRW